ncbi:MAG: hypothetical protein EPN26_14725 [Rhodospirillales bacterium]|nr:MAG: hypothetical protein EPN26_14725 [Rhodospirillales bacterium]
MAGIITAPGGLKRAKFERIGLFFCLAVLAACSEGLVSPGSKDVDDLDTFLRYGAPGGEAQLEIHGNPFGVSSEELASGLAEGFKGGVFWGPDLRFSGNSSSARPGYRFVVAFGAASSVAGDKLCRAAATLALTPKARPIRVKIAYCVMDRALSEVSGQIEDADGPRDSRFGIWAWRLMRALTPKPDSKWETTN